MSKDDATWLKISYLVFALILAYTTSRAMETIGVHTGWVERFDWYPTASIIACIIVGGLGTWVLAANKERNEFFLASIGELRKVTWPSFIDTRRMTIVVCIVVGIFAAILAVFDLIWAQVLKLLMA